MLELVCVCLLVSCMSVSLAIVSELPPPPPPQNICDQMINYVSSSK